MSDGMMFEEKVGILPKKSDMDHDYMMRPVRAEIQLVQNGYKIRYSDKKFVAKTLDEAMNMIKSWMETAEKEAKSKDKEPDKADS